MIKRFILLAILILGITASNSFAQTGNQTIAYNSSSITFNPNTYVSGTVILTGNLTTFVINNGTTNGQQYTMSFCQDGTGGRTIGSGPSNYSGSIGLNTTSNYCTNIKVLWGSSTWTVNSVKYSATVSTGVSTTAPLTNNKIPKTGPINYNVIDSSITDNGTTVSTPEPIAGGLNSSSGGSPNCTLNNVNCPVTPVLGTLLNQTAWTSLTGYTPDGVTPTLVTPGTLTACTTGCILQFTGGSGNFTQTLDWGNTTLLQQWTISGDFILPSPASSTAYGGGFALRSNNSYDQQGLAVQLTMTTASACEIIMYATLNGTPTQVASSTNLSGCNPSDDIYLSWSRNYDTITAFAVDKTAGTGPVSTSYQFSLAYPASPALPNAGRLAVANYGGTWELASLNVNSQIPTNAIVGLLGDSKTALTYAGSMANAFPTRVGQVYKTVSLAGGGDVIADIVRELPEIIALKPSAVVLAIGRNDLCNLSTSLTSVESQYTSLVASLTAANISVFHMLPIPESSSCNQTAYSSWMASTYPTTSFSSGVIANSIELGADNIHPSPTAQPIIATSIINFLQSVLPSQTFQNYYSAQAVTSSSTSTPSSVSGNVTPISGISVACVTSTCNSNRGVFSVTSSTFTTGVALVLTFSPATPTANICSLWQDGGPFWVGWGTAGPATTTTLNISNAVSISGGGTYYVGYNCVP